VKPLLGALLAALLLLTGCAGARDDGAGDAPAGDLAASASPSASASPGAGGIGRYVALGDSYTSAPYVGITDVADGCLRSEQNYPNLFAEKYDVAELVDVSCAGATTRDLTRRQQPFASQVAVPPQLEAVTPDTDLVTLGIGGNDTGLFARVARTCTRLGERDAANAVRAGCAQAAGADLGQIGRHVERALRQVQQRAPEATVVLVGYPRILDGQGCRARLPVAAGDVTALTNLSQRLDQQLRNAADRAGVTYLDLYTASAGHDVCSDIPWVNGARNIPGTAMALHPLAAGQQAVADLLAEEVLD
jgi:lysophospholipase L1-like esterase